MPPNPVGRFYLCPGMGAMKRLTVLVSVSILMLSMVLAPPVAAAPAPPAEPGKMAVYSGDLTLEQMELVVGTGIDRHELVTGRSDVPGAVRVEVILSDGQAAALATKGVALTAKNAATAQQRSLAAEGVFRPYSGPGGLQEEMIQTAADHPKLAKLVVIGKTVNGQDIVAVKVTKDATKVRDGKRPAVLYSSAQHAREWITPEMTRRLLHYYLDNYDSDDRDLRREARRIVDSTELWFVPVANPDGYDYTFAADGDRLWRKNLRDNNGDGQITPGDGVDLNRNFATHWGYDNEGSSDQFASETYRGTGPSSEPETQAMDGLLRRIGFEFQVNYHSAAELLLYGTGFQVATPTPDDLIYEAMVGDDADPAVPGYDPDIAAELYTTNGETTEHAQEAYGTLAFTPEMATCATATTYLPDDEFGDEYCEDRSVFEFPDSKALIQLEFEKNIPFAVAVAQSAQDPSNPVSVVGRDVPDFDVDSFDVSYGDPQTVAVTARRELKQLTLKYRINGGRERSASVGEWRGGERYGDDGNVYFGEYRGTVRGAQPGDTVEVWFTANKPRGKTFSAFGFHFGFTKRVASEHFTYTLEQDGNSVLVLANEDYEGYNPGGPSGTAPKYAEQYVDELAANDVSSAVWDVSQQGVPHDLGVLSHFDAVVWYLGDNRLTQDQEDVETDYFGTLLPDLAVAERQQYLTMAVRDYLNAGGKLAYTGETTGYYGIGANFFGGIWYGLNGAPEADCVVDTDDSSDCLLLSDDFTQYYLGAWSRAERPSPDQSVGVSAPFTGSAVDLTGSSNPLDEAGTFSPTSRVLPVDEFPLFGGELASRYVGDPRGPTEPIEGDWFVPGVHQDDSYMRLARTVDLGAVAAADEPTLRVRMSFDTEPEYDNVIVEAHTGDDDWTTLPEAGGASDSDVPAECNEGFLIDEHPWLTHYLTPGTPGSEGTPCAATGSTGSWNRLTGSSEGWQDYSFDLSAYAGRQVEVILSYVTDPASGGNGVFIDDTRLEVGGAVVEAEGFETGLGPWSTPGPPAGSPQSGDFERSQVAFGSSVTTEDSVLLGFGIEQIAELGGARRAAGIGGGLPAQRPVARRALAPVTRASRGSRHRRRAARCAATGGGSAGKPISRVRVLEDVVERDGEDPRDLERHLQRRRVPTLLDRDDRLPGHPDPVREIGLRHLVVREAKRADRVRDARRLHHGSPVQHL